MQPRLARQRTTTSEKHWLAGAEAAAGLLEARKRAQECLLLALWTVFRRVSFTAAFICDAAGALVRMRKPRFGP